jgi:predicted transporter
MMAALKAVAWAIATIYLTWVFFAAVMNVKRVRDAGKLTRTAWMLGMLTLAIGLVLDLAVNWLIAPVLFLELPRAGEWLLSARITRLVAGGTGWRATLALWMRMQLLDEIDPGGVHTG